MSQPANPTSATRRADTARRPDAAALDAAFAALKAYDAGSSRAALIPIDDAVRDGETDAATAARLEARLLAALQAPLSVVAREFVCAKLALIGSRAAVPTLAAWLTDPNLSDPARAALEVLPGAEAVKALRDHLPAATGLRRLGIINSLGRRRDPRSVPVLAPLAGHADPAIASAATAALGEIGTRPAADALRKLPAETQQRLGLAFADACLACAESLARAGRAGDAARLRQRLNASDQPRHVRAAATRDNHAPGQNR